MLLNLGIWISGHYKRIFLISLALTALGGYLSSKLVMKTQMMDLLPEEEPQVIAYKKALENFTGTDMISIVIEGQEANIIKFIQAIPPKLKKIKNVGSVIYQNDMSFMEKNALNLIKTKTLKKMTPMLTAGNLQDFVQGINDSFEATYISAGDSQKLSQDKNQMRPFFNTIEDFARLLLHENTPQHDLQNVADAFLLGDRYTLSPDRQLGVIFVKTPLTMNDFIPIIPLINDVEALVKKEAKTFQVKAGLAGILVLQRDEMNAIEEDMGKSSLISLVLILAIFYFGFHLLRYTILTFIPLIVGIIISLGLTYLLIGSLNIFTAMMSVILIGLGIDYSIHIIALFTEERVKGTSVESAIALVFQKTAKGIIIGAITTAISFMMFSISSFPGFREFGIVLGIGILSTLLVSIFLLPALLMVFGQKTIQRSPRNNRLLKSIKHLVINKPTGIISMVLILIVISVIKFPDLQFSKDIKDIEPKGLESLALNDKLIEKFDMSADTTIVINDSLTAARAVKDQLADLKSVGMVDSVINYLPSSLEQKQRLMATASIKEQIKNTPLSPFDATKLKVELQRLADNLIELSDLSYIGGEKKMVRHLDKISQSGLITKLGQKVAADAIQLQQLQTKFLERYRKTILAMNSTQPLTVADLPPNVKANYVGKDGSFLTIIYPQGDVWNEKFQPIFLADMERLNVPVTGTFILSEKVMTIAGTEGARVMLYVVIAIFILLLVDFRSLKYAIFAMLPMGGTFLLLLGTMSWWGIKFDYVNIMALPIIIGIGIDDGVHLIHRYLIEKDIVPAIESTGKGILLTSLTTCAAFGSFMVGKYQGFVSFGLVLTIGILLAYFLTVMILPALIILIDKPQMEANK